MYQLLDPGQLMLSLYEFLFGLILFSSETLQVFCHRISPFTGTSAPVFPWVIAAFAAQEVVPLETESIPQINRPRRAH